MPMTPVRPSRMPLFDGPEEDDGLDLKDHTIDLESLRLREEQLMSTKDKAIRDLNWIDLSPHWKELDEAARRLHQYKEGTIHETPFYSNKRIPHFNYLVGLCGEKTYGIEIGMDPCFEVYAGGDGGFDFPGVDVKSTTWGNKYLLEKFDQSQVSAKVYVLCFVDLKNERGTVAGWITTAEFFKVWKPFNPYGYGDHKSVEWWLLNRGVYGKGGELW